MQQTPVIVFKAASVFTIHSNNFTIFSQTWLSLFDPACLQHCLLPRAHHAAFTPAVPGHSAVHALNKPFRKPGLTADVLKALPKIACYPCQENFSLLSPCSPHFRGAGGQDLDTDLMLCLPDWFKLNSDWAAEKSFSAPCSTAASEYNCPKYRLHRARTRSKGSTRSSFLMAGLAPVWPGASANKASHREHALAGGKQLESWLSPTSFGARDTWRCSCTSPVLYFRTFSFSDSWFFTTTLQKACTFFMLALLSVCICNNFSLAENLIKTNCKT